MKSNVPIKSIYYTILCSIFIFGSCLTPPLPDVPLNGDTSKETPLYLYPFDKENSSTVSEIVFETDGSVNLNAVDVEIPALKYNKSWLFLLSQDECAQSSYCQTWAAINGKPLSGSKVYDARHLIEGDLPPEVEYLGKTLGSTDGCGNETRFSFTATVMPEFSWMNRKSDVKKGYTKDFFRFNKKSGLNWDNVTELVNFGIGLAFHNVNANNVQIVDTITRHLYISQSIVKENLANRRVKVMAEPDGNKNYIQASLLVDDIKLMTAQAQSEKIRPFSTNNITRKVLERTFYNSPEDAKKAIELELKKTKEERIAVQIGIHETERKWWEFLLWLNNTYGKNGDDSVWATSLEEYYEYVYYRTHSVISKEIDGNKLKIKITLNGEQNFYYPALTVNIKGIDKEKIVSATSNDATKGFSYNSYEKGITANIDCRKFLFEHAQQYVNQYLGKKTSMNLENAQYFIKQLKDSPEKEELLKKITTVAF